MNLTSQAQSIYTQISAPGTKLGDLRKIAKEIKRDHDLAMELWATGELIPRQMATLIMDKKLLTQEFIDQLDQDIQQHGYDDRLQLADWLMANQLQKDKKTKALMESWEDSPSPIQRRLFWYYQARLRWTGQTPPDNTEDLLASIEEKMVNEVPEVQWAMNFTAGWIGVFDPAHRARCVAIGEKTELCKDEANRKYDVIWSAGLFDYFDDSMFVKLLKKILTWTKHNAEVIIGNFALDNLPGTTGK